ncbi:retinal pigment epithelial membrane protein [Podospora australis]|uniref:Retinal pigment epithelial membrane protein n=1 Tax=Podospora australis TaxID=1536484 RepID=A0AAN6WW51_9PEZI|nr:retinal pigment epithelial membrane protein [Podospora australis]
MSSPVVSDPLKPNHPYLSGNFALVRKTFPLTPCRFEGKILLELAGGQYVRNGSNPLSDNSDMYDAHWFDGDGMLSGVLFQRNGSDIQPEFVNQYLMTDVFAYVSGNRALRRPFLPSIAVLINALTPVWKVVWAVLRSVILVVLSWLPGSRSVVRKTNVANTAVIYHDGRALALCESGPPLRFALPGLETVGWFDGAGAKGEQRRRSLRDGFGGGKGPLRFMRQWTTAHPRVDSETGELLAFHSFFAHPYVRYSVLPPEKSGLAPLFSAPVPGIASPKMMHDFGVSRRYSVILDMPLCFDPLRILKGQPTNPCCIFHAVNCWDTISTDSSANSEVTVNMLVSRLTSASLVFNAANLPAPKVKPVPPEFAEEEQCRLYYSSFPLSDDVDGGPSRPHIRHQWALSSIEFEFSSVSPLYAMTESQYVYGCSARTMTFSSALGKAAKIDILAKINATQLILRGIKDLPQPVKGCVDTRSVREILASTDPNDPIQLFEMPEGWFAQEPRFVPRDDAKLEDDGYLLTYVFDESQMEERGHCREDAIGELSSDRVQNTVESWIG